MKQVRQDNRRSFMKRVALATVAAPILSEAAPALASTRLHKEREAFFSRYQPGIASRQPRHTYFVAFDVTTSNRNELVTLLKAWSQASAEMMAAPEKFDLKADANQAPASSGAAVGLSNTALSLTFGFGATLFEKEGVDRFGIAKQRPEALIDLPRFTGDQLLPERTGGDISVQACANDPQVVEYAVRRMARLAQGVTVMRWAQMGFAGDFNPHETPRNQMGFKDGTINVTTHYPQSMDEFVWVGEEGPTWLRDGTYMVIRPIRISLEHWDEMKLAFQEETIGRYKASGAPLRKKDEFEPLGLEREDKDGNPIINEFSHAALAAPENNRGAQILRRAFSYDNGIAKFAERWPPWRQLVTFDAGLLFQCYQKDPRTGFVQIFEKMAKVDMLNQFTTHTGSGLFACPPGAQQGGFIGQGLLG